MKVVGKLEGTTDSNYCLHYRDRSRHQLSNFEANQEEEDPFAEIEQE